MLELSAVSVLEPSSPTHVHIAHRADEAHLDLCRVTEDAISRILTTAEAPELFQSAPPPKPHCAP